MEVDPDAAVAGVRTVSDELDGGRRRGGLDHGLDDDVTAGRRGDGDRADDVAGDGDVARGNPRVQLKARPRQQGTATVTLLPMVSAPPITPLVSIACCTLSSPLSVVEVKGGSPSVSMPLVP